MFQERVLTQPPWTSSLALSSSLCRTEQLSGNKDCHHAERALSPIYIIATVIIINTGNAFLALTFYTHS